MGLWWLKVIREMLSGYSKKIWAAAVTGLVLCLANGQAARAGEINHNEQGILDAAGGTFYYGGEAYVAADIYMEQLRQELLEDDVDLTAKEADKYITKMYGSIKEGIDEGYLIKVRGSGSATGTQSGGNGQTGQGSGSDGSSQTDQSSGNRQTDQNVGSTGDDQMNRNDQTNQNSETGQNQNDEKGKRGKKNQEADEKKGSSSGTEEEGTGSDGSAEGDVTDGKASAQDGDGAENESAASDDGSTDTSGTGGGNDTEVTVFTFLNDDDASDTGTAEGNAATGKALADGSKGGSKNAEGNDVAADDASHQKLFTLDVLLMLILAISAGISGCLLYRKNKKKTKTTGAV